MPVCEPYIEVERQVLKKKVENTFLIIYSVFVVPPLFFEQSKAESGLRSLCEICLKYSQNYANELARGQFA